MVGIPVVIYIRPNGRQETITCTEIYPEDAQWFTENNVNVSMEMDALEGNIVYGDFGLVVEGTPQEAIVFSRGRTCQDTLKDLRSHIEAYRAK